MASPRKNITITTETEHFLYDRFNDEKSQRIKYENLVKELQVKIVELQQQLISIQEERKKPPPIEDSTKEKPSEQVQYETDEEELAKETEWVRVQSRKKRKLNTSLSPQQQSVPVTNSVENDRRLPKAKKAPQPPPIIVENIKDYQNFYDLLKSSVPDESFLTKMSKGDTVKINAYNENSYRAIVQMLLQNNCTWHSYENKQDRPIRVMAKNLHFSCVPERILEDLSSKGYNILEAVNKLSWRTKQPLNMFMLSFHKDEDIKKIYNIKSILGSKIDIQPIKTSRLIPQCKRCQAYGHTQKYCSKEPRCVKCTGKHLTKDCQKPADAKPKCIHCGEPHPASYRGCIVAKELQTIKNKAQQKNQPSINATSKSDVRKIPSSSKQVTKDLSFAQIIKSTQPQIKNQPKTQKSCSQPSLDDKLNKILDILSSFDERLKKVENKIYKQK